MAFIPYWTIISEAGSSRSVTGKRNDKNIKIIINDNLKSNMGINGYNKVKENYTWPIVVSKIERAYRSLIE